MTRAAQVLHVARKDVSQHRWAIGMYTVLALCATAAAADIGPFSPRFSMMWTMLLMASAVFLMATLVLADSPARVDAFWVTRPLDPLAVLGAKAVLALLVITGIPLLGHVLVLALHGMTADALLADTVRTGINLVRILLFIALIAALTRDMSTFALVAVVLLVLSNILPFWFQSEYLSPVSRAVHVGIIVAVEAATLLLLIHQYRTRNVRRGAVLALALVALMFWIPPREAYSADGEPDALMPQLSVAEVTANAPRYVRGVSTLEFGISGADRSHQYVLHVRKAWFYSTETDGVVDLELNGNVVMLQDPPLPGVGSTVPAVQRPVWSGTMQLRLTPEQAHHVEQGSGGLAVQGDLEILRPQVVAELPLRDGASSTHEGHRFSLASVSATDHDVELRVQATSRGEVRPLLQLRSYGKLRYLLVNETEGTYIELDRSSGSSNGLAGFPLGVTVREMHLLSSSRPAGPNAVAISREWLAGAHLVIVDVKPVGGRRVTLNTNERQG